VEEKEQKDKVDVQEFQDAMVHKASEEEPVKLDHRAALDHQDPWVKADRVVGMEKVVNQETAEKTVKRATRDHVVPTDKLERKD